MNDEKTINQIYDEMSEEQQWAINVMIDSILNGDSSNIKHYGVKGMKWKFKKSAIEKAADNAAEAADIAVDTAKYKVDEIKFRSKGLTGIRGLVGALKLGAARLMLKARVHILKIKTGQIPMFSSKITYTTGNESRTVVKKGWGN